MVNSISDIEDGDEVDENVPVDFGSSDDEKEMVHSTSDIPDGDEVDENITQNVALAACSDISSSDDSSLSLESDPEEPVTEKDLMTQTEQAAGGPASGPECSLCELVAKKPQRLVCDGSLVCWNCAVKVLNLILH